MGFAVLFLTETEILRSVMPDDPDMRKREGAYVRDLLARRKILSAYRTVGGRVSYMIWDVESTDELHKILSEFPMVKYLEFTVTPLVPHPCTLPQ